VVAQPCCLACDVRVGQCSPARSYAGMRRCAAIRTWVRSRRMPSLAHGAASARSWPHTRTPRGAPPLGPLPPLAQQGAWAHAWSPAGPCYERTAAAELSPVLRFGLAQGGMAAPPSGRLRRPCWACQGCNIVTTAAIDTAAGCGAVIDSAAGCEKPSSQRRAAGWATGASARRRAWWRTWCAPAPACAWGPSPRASCSPS